MKNKIPAFYSGMAALPALLLLAGCFLNPALYKKGAFSVDDWETWTSWNDAYGSHDVSGAGLAYRLSKNQDDTLDMPFDGRSPGLILSKEITAGDWTVETGASFKVPAGGLKRFSFGVWAGSEYTRPSLGSPGAALKLLVQRQNGPGPEDDALLVSAPPLRDTPTAIPEETKTLRFRKSGSLFSVFYSLDGKSFTQALRVESADADAAPSYKFFVGGRSDGDPDGARAKFTSLRINGRETFK